MCPNSYEVKVNDTPEVADPFLLVGQKICSNGCNGGGRGFETCGCGCLPVAGGGMFHNANI